MEHGYFHPSHGYWQTTSDVPEAVLAAYPEGTIEVPLKPGPSQEWDGTQWQIVPPSQSEVLEAVKARRDQAISSGITISGVPIHTDETSQTRIMGAAVAAMLDPDYSVQWKAADGTFVMLTAVQVIGIASAVRAHVQACFDREAVLRTAVASGEPYDIESGWPGV